MGDRKFILLELHMDGDLQIGPKTVSRPGSGKVSELLGGEEESEEAAEPFADEGGRSLPVGVGAILLLGVMVGVAFVLRRVFGDEEAAVGEEFGVDVGE